MLYRKVNRMGDLKFSLLGFGCWSLGSSSGWSSSSDSLSTRALELAIDNGVTLFDTAPVYGFGSSETLLGKVIKGKRDGLIIASKCGLVWDDANNITNDLTQKSVLNELDNSLRRLDIDYIDIYQLHWPDNQVNIDDLENTIQKLLDTKKIKYIGLSNFSLNDCKILSKNKNVVSYQGLYNLFEPNEQNYHGIELDYKMKDEILPFCRDNGMSVFPYSPLMQGILTDDFNASDIGKDDVRNSNPKFSNKDSIKVYLDKRDKLIEYGKSIDMSLLEIAYGWLSYQNEITSIISGATKEEQVIKNIKACATILKEQYYNEIEKIAYA